MEEEEKKEVNTTSPLPQLNNETTVDNTPIDKTDMRENVKKGVSDLYSEELKPNLQKTPITLEPKTRYENEFGRTAEEQEEYDRTQKYLPQDVPQTQVSQNFDAKEGLSGDLNGRINSVIENSIALGAMGNSAMQNISIPRNKVYTIKDIMNDPSLEGMRDYLLADKLGTMWQNVGSHLAGKDGGYKSRVEEYNDIMNENYAKNKANVDTSATQGNIDAIQAGLAQQVALETSLADTVANEYIKRYKSLQDAEDKKLLLQKMADDDYVWSKLEDDQKLNLAAYMGITSGDYSLTDLLIQKYAPRLLDGLDAFMDTLTDGKWSAWKSGQRNTNGNPDSPTDEKKNETVEGFEDVSVWDLGGRQITPQDVAQNPDIYMKIPLGMGKVAVVKKYTSAGVGGRKTSDTERDAIYDAIAESTALTPEQKEEYALEYGTGRKLWGDMPFNASRYMKDRLNAQEAALEEQQRLEAERIQKEKDFVKAVQDIRDNYSMPPEDKVKKLNALDPSVTANAQYLQLYQSQLQQAQAQADRNELNKKVSDATKEMDNIYIDYKDEKGTLGRLQTFRDNNSALIAQSPDLKKKLDNLEQDVKIQCTLHPTNADLNKALTKALGTTTLYYSFGEGDITVGGRGVGIKTVDTKKANSYANAISQTLGYSKDNGNISIPTSIASVLTSKGITALDDMKMYVRNTQAFKALKNLMNCPYYKKEKNQDSKEYQNLKKVYDYYGGV